MIRVILRGGLAGSGKSSKRSRVRASATFISFMANCCPMQFLQRNGAAQPTPSRGWAQQSHRAHPSPPLSAQCFGHSNQGHGPSRRDVRNTGSSMCSLCAMSTEKEGDGEAKKQASKDEVEGLQAGRVCKAFALKE